MSVPLPNLDDTRWEQLVEEGKALIPVHAPDWTDHNGHDPGITLMELFAWITEMDVYQVNRVPDSHKHKFLSLAGIAAASPAASRTLIQAALHDNSLQPLALPAGVEFDAPRAGPLPLRFRTTEPVTIVAASIGAVQAHDGTALTDVSDHFLNTDDRREPAYGFGVMPAIGAALYIGLDVRHPSVHQKTLQLHIRFANQGSGEDERRRLLEEVEHRGRLCRELAASPCVDDVEPASEEQPLPFHHSAAIVWEYAVAEGGGLEWRTLDAKDNTRSMTLDGKVCFRLPADSAPQRMGCPPEILHYVRCRLVRGEFDASPLVSELLLNAAAAEQSAPAVQKWTIAKGVSAQGSEPSARDTVAVNMTLDALGEITALSFDPAAGPGAATAAVVDYKPAEALTTGSLMLDLVLCGVSDGGPNQEFELPQNPVLAEGFELWSLNGEVWTAWNRLPNLDSSGPADAHYTLDAGEGTVRLGDGEHGAVPVLGALIFARFFSTEAAAGNVPRGHIEQLADSAWNRMLLGTPSQVAARLGDTANPVAATGGKPAESLAAAVARAIDLREARLRAVTTADYEHLALSTPGTKLARAEAKPNLSPGFDCWKAPGFVTVVILPAAAGRRPAPSLGLRKAVKRWLDRRRMVGTRVEVIGPDYTDVRIRATVRAFPGQNRQRLATGIATALDEFFSPLTGGPGGAGWPLGRDVYVAEVLHVIAGTPGVDHVAELELIAGGCAAQCGNICLPANGLVAAGRHEIEVII